MRDFFRPAGGTSRLTLRRFLVLVDGLSVQTSRFWCAILEKDPISNDTAILGDIFQALTGEPHRIITRREDMERERQREEQAARILAAEEMRQKMIEARRQRG